jgi:asparagine synthetase B (glutamine-hydrolysing)
MPTGYTCIIEDGATFEQFVWRCARGVGMLANMREESMDAVVPEAFTPGEYYVKSVEEARTRLYDLERMTVAEAAVKAREEYDEAIAENVERHEKARLVRDRYLAMRDHVAAWEPPTADHQPMKKFMLEQIDESMRFDRHVYQVELPTLDGASWLADEKSDALKDLDRAEKSLAEEIKRTDTRNRWIRQLRLSVPYPSSTVSSR